jgi:cytochrome c oxidase accessory protein FixG
MPIRLPNLTQHSAPSTQHCAKPSLLGPWRRTCQWLTTLLVLATPFVSIDGNSLLRLDFTTLTLHVAGRTLPIEALWLLLLFTLLLVLLFLLVTLAFGRAWCGWACPQTTLVDLVEWCARRIGVKVSAGTMTASPWQQALMRLVYLALALLVGANLTWYFIAPADFFTELRAGSLHWAAWTLLGGTAAAVFLDLALLRRLFCKEFCPYGRFQTVLVDAGTLTLRYHPDEAPRCIRCGACVRACPTGIDIRNGYQVECINCGRCLDACREVMAHRHQAGIIRYTFGLHGRGLRALRNPRMALVATACLFLTAGLLVAATQRSPLTLKAARNPALLPQSVTEDRVINFFTVYLVNRSDRPVTASISVEARPLVVQWRGPDNRLRLAGNEHRRLDFGIEADAAQLAAAPQIELVLQDAAGKRLAATSLTLIAPLARPTAKTTQ